MAGPARLTGEAASGDRPEAIFARNAVALAAAGFAVVPTARDKKKPMVRWARLTTAPRRRTIESWMARPEFASANIGALCGPTGVNVVDVDSNDPRMHAFAREQFGDTPVVQRTPSNGRHYFYRASVEASLIRMYGLPIDLLAGRAFVLLAPSRREDGERYEWLLPPSLTLADAMRALRPIKAAALPSQLARPGLIGPLTDVPIGQRNNTLFRAALNLARRVESAEEVEMHLQIFNEGIRAGPLSDSEVTSIAQSAWRYEIEGRNWSGTGDPANRALDLIGNGSDAALRLFLVLRKCHARRNAAFAVSPAAMAKANVIPNWTKHAFRRARDELVDRRVLVCVHKSRGKGDPSLYEISPHARF